MEQSQMTGVFIMIGATLQMILFLWAIARRSYMALALPVMVALAAISALAFWIGWTMFTTEPELEEELEEEEALP
jgi:uncharacterized membrane protein YesL